MTALVRPDVVLARSWIATVEDFGDWFAMHGSGQWLFDEPLPATVEGCATLVARVLAAEPADRHGTRVASTFYWITDDAGDVIGFLHLRHTLNDWLLEEGGHIGYSVRPSSRRQGHATRALALAVRHAAELGIDRALVTCDDDNAASAGTIERCGGVLEDVRHGKRRYWIRTS